LEHYSSAHPETIDQLLDWPWLRFERFYAAFMLRTLVERLDRQRDAIVAALYGNSVFDEHAEAKRDESIQAVDDSFNQAIAYVRSHASGEPDEDDGYDENDPFWVAAKRGVAEIEVPRSDEQDYDFTAGELVEEESEAKEMARLVAELDQS
jgi:hypothetical protein